MHFRFSASFRVIENEKLEPHVRFCIKRVHSATNKVLFFFLKGKKKENLGGRELLFLKKYSLPELSSPRVDTYM